jgi:hypothetical protein
MLATPSPVPATRLAAQMVRTGWYREVTIKSLDSRLSRSLIQRCVLEYSLPDLNVAERKWPGNPVALRARKLPLPPPC